MDWTGGSRRRYLVPKNNTVMQKQKAHFARVRVSNQHTPISHSRSRALLADNPGSIALPQPDQLGDVPSHDVGGALTHDLVSKTYVSDHDRILKCSATGIARTASRDRQVGMRTTARKVTNSVRASSTGRKSVDERSCEHSFWMEKDALTANEKDILLLTKRRKLLARSDWLNLAPTRPLRMYFPMDCDSNQVGRRKEFRNSSMQLAKSTRQRPLTPIFEGRVRTKYHHISRALPAEDENHVHIKIGTDALASQSGYSRKPSTPASLSTDFSPLSEKSMLLGADGDTFDADEVTIPVAALSTCPNDFQNADSMYAFPGSQSPGRVDEQRRELDPPQTFQEGLRFFGCYDGGTSHALNRSCAEEEAAAFVEVCQGPPDERLIAAGISTPEPSPGTRQPSSTPLLETAFQSSVSQRLPYDVVDFVINAPSGKSRSVTPSDGADKAWMHLLGLPQNDLDHTSIAALVSCSEHITTSESMPEVILNRTDALAPQNGDPVSTPKGAGTQASFLDHQHSKVEGPEVAFSTTGSEYPSESLKQIRGLAQQPGIQAGLQSEESDGDALWRDFVIGSQSSETNQHLFAAAVNRQDDMAVTSGMSQLPDVSGPDNSGWATKGNSLFVTGDTSSPHNTSKCFRKASPTNMSYNSHNSFGSLEVEDDTIEDACTLPPVVKKLANIHASAVKSLNPKRFERKKPKSRPAAMRIPIKSQRPLPRKRDMRCAEKHSIYDLVDSDARSIA